MITIQSCFQFFLQGTPSTPECYYIHKSTISNRFQNYIGAFRFITFISPPINWRNVDLSPIAIRSKGLLLLSTLFTLVLDADYLPGYGNSGKASSETARKWLHELGVSVIDAKKGAKVDGHEQ